MIEILGKLISREEWEEDEKIVYLTLMDMFLVVSLIAEIEKGPSQEDGSDIASIRNKLFAEVWGNPVQMERLNEVKKKFLADIKEKLEEKEDAE